MSDQVDNKRFVQYFIVCGLDLNFGLEPDESQSGLEGAGGGGQECNPLERSYKPRVLQHYPDITAGRRMADPSSCVLTLSVRQRTRQRLVFES